MSNISNVDNEFNKKYAIKFKNFSKDIRFYSNILPSKDNFVMATITKYTDVGIFCLLDEYKKEAFMSFKDASSSRKLRVIRKEVLKNRKYILTVHKVDTTKNFVDVEKRNIDASEQKEMTGLINFYQRIFIIFIKTFIFNNIDCTIDDVYSFLEKTLWLDDPKNIKKNMNKVHTDIEYVIKTYNLSSELGNKIVDTLKSHLEKPIYEHKIELKINSISLEAVNDIKELLSKCENTIGCEFKTKSSPNYYTNIKNDYIYKKDIPFNVDLYTNKLKNTLEKIKSEMKEDLFMDIVNIEQSYILDY